MSALEHIHPALPHRFRTRKAPALCDPREVDLVKERVNMFGTLSWASLNALNGIELNLRDDLESLTFVLIYFLHCNAREKKRRR
ncbi:hypothetical protein M413DRAFT_445773 [Hebeloma cylindrosporum]|uniref:Uncharacterized protein n=1 Tax=Hebeloma cylindrosporum TaxID=76867 RepID=A0A0C3BWM6_HEBCY|nr:hypothetical protein M413DRAFT_445773 [Hebeloma cylindrosporum h7]